ncbi:MAG: succinate dehydrogenase / fumarate reductase iron-sulfur subunit [Chlamydiales bacterium]|jgi:succinate dehydrogenase / fumarate reductase iron-sulfur subunit
MADTFTLKIFRGHPGMQYWEEFELDLVHSMNVISSLMEIRKKPVNKEGKRVEPVVWEDGCLEEVCGSCSMLVDGKPRQACTALISNLLKGSSSNTVTLAPFTKFPLVRDLIVDRNQMFENLKKVNAWIDVDGSFDTGPGPKISQKKQEIMYTLSTCMTCGCCSEACPEVNDNSSFVGPAPIAQVRLFNAHPTGKMQRDKRLRPLMEEGGISGCGNAQNCVRVCPKEIPLTDAIAALGRDTTLQAFRDFFSFPDRED